jgi:nitrite reductase (cytochrome c-552)
VDTIQQRTFNLMQRAAAALVAQMDAINAARRAGVTDAQLKGSLDMHRKAQWRLDFIAAENSMGFHASQEAARILGEAIDYARQGQVMAQAQHLRTPTGAATMPATQPVQGITPRGKAPTDANQR